MLYDSVSLAAFLAAQSADRFETLLAKPLKAVSGKIGVNEISVLGMVSCLVTSATTFGMMDKMDKKGTVLNSAFAVSGAFALGSHLAFTMAFDEGYVAAVVAGKLVAGVLALLLANVIYSKSREL